MEGKSQRAAVKGSGETQTEEGGGAFGDVKEEYHGFLGEWLWTGGGFQQEARGS